MTTSTSAAHWDDAIRSFRHIGPGGDAALAAAHPDLAQAIRELQPRQVITVAGVPVTRQDDGNWQVGHDRNLASPWVVVQSVRGVTVDAHGSGSA